MNEKVSVDRIGELTGLTPRRVQQLAKEGVIPKASRGKYPLDESIQAYIRFLQEKVSHRDTSDIKREIALEELRARKDRNDENDGLRVPLEEVDALISAVAVQFGTMVGALGARLESDLAGVEDREEIRGIIDRAAKDVRTETADRLLACTEGGPKQRRRLRQATA